MTEQDAVGGFALLLVAVGMPVALLVMAAVCIAADRRARRAAADVNARILHHPDHAAGLARLTAVVREQQKGDQA